MRHARRPGVVRCVSLLLLLALSLARPARAQCGANVSSCVACHETQRQRPVLTDGTPWHRDHGFCDMCTSCHEGAGDEPALETAHTGLRRNLGEMKSVCASCHQDASEAFVARYAAFSPTPTPSAPPGASGAPVPVATRMIDLVLAAVAIVLGLVISAIVWRRRRAGAGLGLLGWLRAVRWSPLVAGGGLGVVVAVTEVGTGHTIAVSGAFDKLAAYPGRALLPESQYYTHIISPGITWQVWMVVGLLLGSFIASRLAGTAYLRWLPDTQWVPRFGPRRLPRLVVAFLGAVLVQLGAGIAGGCTSGLAISGGAVLAPAAFLFMAGMFAGGIPTAGLIYRKKP